jgi:hypothetical protein
MTDKTKKFHELLNRLDALEKEQGEIEAELFPLIRDLAIERSPYKLGDIVKKGIVLTRIEGRLDRRGGIIRDYYGRKILKDGTSLHSNETRLYEWGDGLS